MLIVRVRFGLWYITRGTIRDVVVLGILVIIGVLLVFAHSSLIQS